MDLDERDVPKTRALTSGRPLGYQGTEPLSQTATTRHRSPPLLAPGKRWLPEILGRTP